MNKPKGYTLLELLFTLVVIFILTSIAIPSFTSLIESSRSRHLYNTVFTLIQYVRGRSIFLYEDVIICPTKDDINCINNWQLPLIIFIDLNKNKKRDFNEPIDQKINLLKKDERFIWRASGTSRYLRFHTNGLTSSQNGSFTICPRNNKTENIRKIILYYTGRARRAERQNITKEDCNKI